MYLVISEVLSTPDVEAIADFLNEGEIFRDGTATAGAHAREVKNNLQADPKLAAPVTKKVEAVLRTNPVFMAWARPQSFVKLLVSRYEPGMAYGTHVDNPMMDGKRVDLSFTLFLASPDTYGGGELVIDGNDGEKNFKLPAGSMIVYPATTLHRVNGVTKGKRLAVVGWIRSLIRDHSQREILFDLDNVVASLSSADRATVDKLHMITANLTRMWVDD